MKTLFNILILNGLLEITNARLTNFEKVIASNFKSYCTTKVCNKCRSYLVRNYRDRLWLMCSALARNDECCSFLSGPTLFTTESLKGACESKPGETEILMGYVVYDDENCDGNNDTLASDLKNLIDINQDEICNDNDDCFNLTDEMTKLEEKAKEEEESDKPVFQMNQMSSGKADCKIRKNNYISCAAVQQQERMDNIKTGLGYTFGSLFFVLVGALVAVVIKFKKKEDVRLQQSQAKRNTHNGPNLKDSFDDDKAKMLTKSTVSYQNE